MKKFTLALMAISLLLVSCKKADVEDKADELINGTTELKADEINIAKQICSALKDKRLLFESYGDGEKSFPFRVTSKICSSRDEKIETFITALRVPTRANPYFQDPGVDLFVSDIETDIDGHLSSLCSEIEKGNAIKKLENAGTYSDRHDFFLESGYHHYQITRSIENKATRLTKLAIVTRDNETRGMVKMRTSESLCRNRKISKVVQLLRL